ncbi:(2,3-dihydroxybenzoyl)adenylate synthase [Solwaraspora sp. WMMB335]|uniref:(2,3-dihydroxybenzoyl)adenylate synthase n=1 Tax=Solwaraspora sp. WMMB335 TaxID=3404118 RepID=UPI003B95A58B
MLDGCTPWPAADAERYRAAGHWRGRTLPEALADAVHAYGTRTALVSGPNRVSYAELGNRVASLAAGLRDRGVGVGDRVVVQLPNRADFVVVCFALFALDAKPVFALPAHRTEEITHLVRQTEAIAIVVAGVAQGFDFVTQARRVRAECPSLRDILVTDSGMATGDAVALDDLAGAPADVVAADPSDVAFFLLSGGTTALPKLIPRTHDDYLYQAMASAEVIGLRSQDVYLAVLPVGFNFTWGCPGVIGTLLHGGTVVFCESPAPEMCFPLIDQERVTVTSTVPSVTLLWLEAAEWAQADLSTLRLLQIGSAKLHPKVAARIEPELGCRLQQVFGMAEGLLTCTRDNDSAETVLNTQGRPLSTADEMRIVGPDDREVAPGEIGELHARGPYTLRGYYRAPEHNARAFTADGFYRTGDLARLTPGGELVVEGRLKDVVIRGGDKISAPEVEQHLLTHPAVAQVAVVAEPDESLGERVCAVVVPARGLSEDRWPRVPELRRLLMERGLASFKTVDRVHFVEEFPLTGLGKISKAALTAQLAKVGNDGV